MTNNDNPLPDSAMAGLQAILAETVSPAALRRSLRVGVAVAYLLGTVFGLVGLVGAVIVLASDAPVWALAPLLFGGFGVTVAALVIRQHSRILRRLRTASPARR